MAAARQEKKQIVSSGTAATAVLDEPDEPIHQSTGDIPFESDEPESLNPEDEPTVEMLPVPDKQESPVITTAQTNQAVAQTQNQFGNNNAAKLAKLKSDAKEAQSQVDSARETEISLRSELGLAKKDYEEAQEMMRVSKQKLQRLTNAFSTASDARGAAQSRLNVSQGQLSQLTGIQIG